MSVIASKMCHKCALMLGLAAPSETAHFALQSLALICHMFGTYQILAAEPEIAIDKSLTFPSTVHFHYNSSVFKNVTKPINQINALSTFKARPRVIMNNMTFCHSHNVTFYCLHRIIHPKSWILPMPFPSFPLPLHSRTIFFLVTMAVIKEHLHMQSIDTKV